MGISNFLRYIKTISPSSTRDVSTNKSIGPYQHKYFDINCLLYSVLRKDKEFNYNYLYSQINYLEKFTGQPLETVFFAMDGPGPRCKLNTQRARRLEKKSSYQVQFTPGTKVMQYIKDTFSFHCVKTLSESYNKHLKLYISGSDDVGEGELKIFEHLNSVYSHNSLFSNILNNTSKISSLVVGNDSDLILFGLRNSSRIPSLDLLKITNEGKALISIENIRKDIIKDILDEIKTKGINVNDFISEESIIMDFIFVIVLNGSDYLPALRYYSQSHAWECYKNNRHKYKEPLFQKIKKESKEYYQINVQFLNDIHREISFLSEKDQTPVTIPQEKTDKSICNELAQKLYKNNSTCSYVTHENSSDEKSIFESNLFINSKLISSGIGATKKNAEQNAASNAIPILTEQYEKICKESNSPPPPPRPTSIRVHKGEIPTDETHDNQMEMFVKGLVWNMEYLKGHCADYSYCYPYQAAPTFSKFVNWKKLGDLIQVPSSLILPPSPLEFSITLLPPPYNQVLYYFILLLIIIIIIIIIYYFHFYYHYYYLLIKVIK